MAGWSPTGLMYHIMDNPMGDAHWFPQYLYMVPGAMLVPYNVLPSRYGYAKLRINVTQPLLNDPVPPRKLISSFYSVDMALWKRALSERRC
jgi:hypothetical protein